MIPLFRTVQALLAISVFVTPSTFAQSNEIQIDEIVATHQVEPRFPATMRAIGIKEGNVSLAISVDEYGNATDVFVVESSRRAFAQSALKSIESWNFQPARYNGTSFPSTILIKMDFELGRNLRWHTFTAPVETNVTQNHPSEQPITAVALEKLDNIPLPLEIVEPSEGERGLATVEFYIDELGNVRCPKLVSGNSLDFGRTTIDAISQWRFQPPISQGIQTNTMVRQTFRFVDGKLATSKPI